MWQYTGEQKTPTWVWYMAAVYLSLPVLVYVLLPKLYGNISTKKRVIIFVLGDLGHSPRVCYHARSFANKGWSVDLCGYLEEQPPMDLIENDDVEIHSVSTMHRISSMPYALFSILKVLHQLYSISLLLWKVRGANYILIQNPPSIPILLISVVFKLLTRTKLIIDWHNLNYTVLSIKLGPNHPFVKLSKLYESFFSKFADLNLTVTRAMKSFLIDNFDLKPDKIIVLYDKAANQFKPLTQKEKDAVIANHPMLYSNFNAERDKLIISSTSFTLDEDFNVLIKALQQYDTNSQVPNLKVIVTGKGPLKQEFLEQVKISDFKKVQVDCAWLTAEDYPKILGTADLGISLHTSSSGIDLPMKVVDMFGCGLPVIALDFLALPELVNDLNGKRVKSSEEIYESLVDLLTNDKTYAEFKKNAVIKSGERWETNWKSEFGDKLI